MVSQAHTPSRAWRGTIEEIPPPRAATHQSQSYSQNPLQVDWDFPLSLREERITALLRLAICASLSSSTALKAVMYLCIRGHGRPLEPDVQLRFGSLKFSSGIYERSLVRLDALKLASELRRPSTSRWVQPTLLLSTIDLLILHLLVRPVVNHSHNTLLCVWDHPSGE